MVEFFGLLAIAIMIMGIIASRKGMILTVVGCIFFGYLACVGYILSILIIHFPLW